MISYKILESFENLNTLSTEQLEELCSELRDIMEFGDQLQSFKNQIVLERRYEKAAGARLIERMVMRCIAEQVLMKYGIELLTKPWNQGQTTGMILFEDIPAISVEELRLRILNGKALEM